MSSPSQMPELRRSFFGWSADAARDAASEWLRDFDSHEPFEIRDINTSPDGMGFITTVAYSVVAKRMTAPSNLEERPFVKPGEEGPGKLQIALARFRQSGSAVSSRSAEAARTLSHMVSSATAQSESLERADDLKTVDLNNADSWAPLLLSKTDKAGLLRGSNF